MKKVSVKAKKPYRLTIFLAALGVAVIATAVLLSFSKKEGALNDGDKTPYEQPAGTSKNQTGGNLNKKTLIQSIRFQPDSPTRLDTLRVEVIPLSRDSGSLKYAYIWKVNGKVITEETGDTLDLSPFKKRDLVSVAITPYEDDIAGYTVKSPVVAIQSIPPSLEMKITRKTVRIGEPFELQLLSDHPDSETASYSLEEPRVDGMTIDSRTGKISWTIQPNQQGSFRFGSAVLDSEGTRVTKIFEINLNQAQAAPQTQ